MRHANTGTLYIVATPIGNLGDFTFRAVEVLQEVNLILCEDTRVSRVLLKRYALRVPTESLHRHNEARKSTGLIARLLDGANIALLSDAGTPVLSDAGCRLICAAHQNSIPVLPLPGASALTAALSCAGFSADRFVFEGFLPPMRAARLQRLRHLAPEPRTLVVFEAPHRIVAALDDMAEVFGSGREACLAKELSKVHEAVVRGTFNTVRHWLSAEAGRVKGEFVVLVQGRPDGNDEMDELTLPVRELLRALREHLPPGKVAGIVSGLSGLPRRHLYHLLSGGDV